MCRNQDDEAGGAAELGEAGNLDQHRERQRQHAEGAVAAVAHDLEAPRWFQRMRTEPVSGVGETVFMQGTRDQHGRADGQHCRQPARTRDAAHDGEDQTGREADAGADEGQHRQDIGELPARQADIELEAREEGRLLLRGLQPFVERGRTMAAGAEGGVVGAGHGPVNIG